MPRKQGDVGLLQEPLAQQLLHSMGLAHLAYTWHDGTPRVIPTGFHWNGEEIVMVTSADAPKTRVLTNGSKVAVSIDLDFAASKTLFIRETVRVETAEGLAPEYVTLARQSRSQEDAEAHLKEAARIYPRMTRICIRPDWVGLLDFETGTRLPSFVERAIERIGKEHED